MAGTPGTLCLLHTDGMTWSASPSAAVLRKRLILEGAAESGRVTSVVWYQPKSQFHTHNHPDGEEILVLEGVFVDERGSHGPGTYMLNPEGYVHTPRSEDGCLLFVKLRQYGGPSRCHRTLQTADMPWQDVALGVGGRCGTKTLHSSPDHPDSMFLRQCSTHDPVDISNAALQEIFVIQGELTVQCGDDAPAALRKGSFLHLPPATPVRIVSARNAEFYHRIGEWRADTPAN